MSVQYNVSPNGLRIETYPDGILGIKETVDYFERLKSDENIKPGAVEIIYFKNVTDFRISYLEGETIVRKYQEAIAQHMIEVTIFVCETNVAYGIGRMLKALHEIANPRHKVMFVRSESEIDNVT